MCHVKIDAEGKRQKGNAYLGEDDYRHVMDLLLYDGEEIGCVVTLDDELRYTVYDSRLNTLASVPLALQDGNGTDISRTALCENCYRSALSLVEGTRVVYMSSRKGKKKRYYSCDFRKGGLTVDKWQQDVCISDCVPSCSRYGCKQSDLVKLEMNQCVFKGSSATDDADPAVFCKCDQTSGTFTLISALTLRPLFRRSVVDMLTSCGLGDRAYADEREEGEAPDCVYGSDDRLRFVCRSSDLTGAMFHVTNYDTHSRTLSIVVAASNTKKTFLAFRLEYDGRSSFRLLNVVDCSLGSECYNISASETGHVFWVRESAPQGIGPCILAYRPIAPAESPAHRLSQCCDARAIISRDPGEIINGSKYIHVFGKDVVLCMEYDHGPFRLVSLVSYTYDEENNTVKHTATISKLKITGRKEGRTTTTTENGGGGGGTGCYIAVEKCTIKKSFLRKPLAAAAAVETTKKEKVKGIDMYFKHDEPNNIYLQ